MKFRYALLVVGANVSAAAYAQAAPPATTAKTCAALKPSAEQRAALVIGNSVYTKLESQGAPVKNSDFVFSQLCGMGFKTTYYTDLTAVQFESAITAFESEAGKSGISLIYYSGHAVSISGDEQFLLATDGVVTDSAVKNTVAMYRLKEIVARSTHSGFVISDACRDRIKEGAHVERYPDLAHAEDTWKVGTYFSTYNEFSATPPPDAISRFTQNFFTYLAKPGESLTSAFVRTAEILKGPPPAPAPTTDGVLLPGSLVLVSGREQVSLPAASPAAQPSPLSDLPRLQTDYRARLFYWLPATAGTPNGAGPPSAYHRGLEAFAAGGAENFKAARELFRQAADAGEIEAKTMLAYMYATQRGGPYDYIAAYRLWKEAAKDGSAVAADSLGVLYRDGIGVDANLTTALAYFRQASGNLAAAKADLADMYLRKGSPLKHSRSEAIRLLEEAIAGPQPDPSALNYLASLELGTWLASTSPPPPISNDLKMSGLAHLRQAADLGNPEALMALAKLAWRESRTEDAQRFLSKAAASGWAEAQVRYGRFLECKWDVASRKLALDNYDDAAKTGNQVAAASSLRLARGQLLQAVQCQLLARGYTL